MKKVIALLDKTPEISEPIKVLEEMRLEAEAMKNRHLEEMANFSNNMKDKRNAAWEIIHEYATKNCGYDEDKYSLTFSVEKNSLEMYPDEESCFADIVQQLKDKLKEKISDN